MDIELSLHDYWRILRKRKWSIFGAFLATFLSVIFYTRIQIPVYRARAVVKFEPPATRLTNVENGAFDPSTVFEAQLRVLASQEMADRVAKKLGWDPARTRGVIQAEHIENADLIVISASGPDPVAVTDITNAAVDAYSDLDLETRTLSARRALEEVVQRRQEVEDSLQGLEDQRKRFMERHPSAGAGGNLANSLLDLESQRRELLKKFTPEHPDVIKLDQRIQSVRAQLERAPTVDTDFERINRDAKVNEEMYITLSRQMEEAKVALASTLPYVSVVAKATIPDSPVWPNKRLNYLIGIVLGVFLGLIIAFTLENLDISITTIEEIEKLLGVPVLGIIPHFGTEQKWAAFRTKLLRKQRYPMDIFRSHLVFHHKAKSPFIEVYHSLRANIRSQVANKEHMVLTFTSTGVAEGKTLTSVNFCLAAAQAGLRTLLVGADIRRPVIHRIFGLPKEMGLLDALTGQVHYEDVLKGTVDFLMGELDLDKLLVFPGIDNFKIMTGWSASTNDVVNVLSSDAVSNLIAQMRPHFELIVFDCPPVLLFVDAMLIGANTDGVVMVYKSGKMARRALKRAKDQIVAAKADMIGVVLNDMHASDMEPRYGYYYDYGHYAKKEENS